MFNKLGMGLVINACDGLHWWGIQKEWLLLLAFISGVIREIFCT